MWHREFRKLKVFKKCRRGFLKQLVTPCLTGAFLVPGEKEHPFLQNSRDSERNLNRLVCCFPQLMTVSLCLSLLLQGFLLFMNPSVETHSGVFVSVFISLWKLCFITLRLGKPVCFSLVILSCVMRASDNELEMGRRKRAFFLLCSSCLAQWRVSGGRKAKGEHAASGTKLT